MKKTIMAPFAAAAMLLGMAGPAAAASSGPLEVRIVTVTTASSYRGLAVITGAVNAACEDGPPVVTLGPAGSFDVQDRIVCPNGTLFVSAHGVGTLLFDPDTCVAHVPQGGTVEFTGGTGDFSGASGGGTFSGEGRAVFSRTAEGCVLDQPPRIDVLRINLRGTLTT